MAYGNTVRRRKVRSGQGGVATPRGFRLYAEYFSALVQRELVGAVMAGVREAPLYRPITPSGAPMSVEMTNFGPLGWVTDARGYRYEAVHPVTGAPWPAIPSILVELWAELAPGAPQADACLVNVYREGARMGLHQDRDEADFAWPVISVSIGDTARFRIGGRSRRDPTTSMRLASGDVCVLADDARLAFHGIDRIHWGTSTLAPGGGRINLTLRRAR